MKPENKLDMDWDDSMLMALMTCGDEQEDVLVGFDPLLQDVARFKGGHSIKDETVSQNTCICRRAVKLVLWERQLYRRKPKALVAVILCLNERKSYSHCKTPLITGIWLRQKDLPWSDSGDREYGMK